MSISVEESLRGSFTVAVTPFRADGSEGIDVDALHKFLDWQIRSGVPGVIMLGTTGEFLAVSGQEREVLVSETVGFVAGRMKVLVGAMNAYTPTAVSHARQAEDLGADGLMVLPPYYYTPTDDEIFNYYRSISI